MFDFLFILFFGVLYAPWYTYCIRRVEKTHLFVQNNSFVEMGWGFEFRQTSNVRFAAKKKKLQIG